MDGLASFSGCREWSTMLILTRVRLWLKEVLSLALDPGGMSSHEAGRRSPPSAPQSRRSPALICHGNMIPRMGATAEVMKRRVKNGLID